MFEYRVLQHNPTSYGTAPSPSSVLVHQSTLRPYLTEVTLHFALTIHLSAYYVCPSSSSPSSSLRRQFGSTDCSSYSPCWSYWFEWCRWLGWSQTPRPRTLTIHPRELRWVVCTLVPLCSMTDSSTDPFLAGYSNKIGICRWRGIGTRRGR